MPAIVRKTTRDAGLVIAFLALAAMATLTLLHPQNAPFGLTYLLLPAMAIIAEFLPVNLSSRGVRITFTLPYVAGMAVAVGPVPALATDVLVTLIAGYALVVKKGRRVAPFWMAVNASVAALSCSLGAFLMLATRARVMGLNGHEPILALTFMIPYGVVNFGLVSFFEGLTDSRKYAASVVSALQVGFKSLALYVLVAVAVAILVQEGLVAVVPLTIVPVWALRTGLLYQARMYDHYYETISALTLMLQRAHPYTHGHLERVALIAEEVARKLGLTRQRARLVREAAVLHDIGKIAVDEAILDKPAKLSEPEMEHVRRHSVCGAQILAPVRQFHELLPWIRHHHERPDGTGYPDRLTDAEIPIESKIIAVVDAYDAMTGGSAPEHHRSYRIRMTTDEALEELERCSGTQFDRRVVRVFRGIILEGRA